MSDVVTSEPEPTATHRAPSDTPRRWWLVEGALIASLTIGWVSAYVAASQNLNALTPARQQFQLDLSSTRTPLWIALALGLASCAALVLRLWSATAAFVVVAVLVVAAQAQFQLVTSQNFVPELTLALATFWAARSATRRRAPAVLVGAVLAFALSAAPAFRINPRLDALVGTNSATLDATTGTVLAVLVAVCAYVAGRRFHRVNEQARELAERNAELATERLARAERAVQDERIRIARELHDVVAHHVTTMTLHAGAARQLSVTDSDKATEAMLQVEQSGREAVAEMHRLLGFLRGEQTDDDRSPTPTLDQLARLVDSYGNDPKVTLTETGERRELSPTANLSAYRIVQEALTNATKHSGASTVAVEVAYGANEVELRITDDGKSGAAANRTLPGGATDTPSGSGHGLIGMRERALLHEGTLEAGPQPDGGWLVRATLNYGGNRS